MLCSSEQRPIGPLPYAIGMCPTLRCSVGVSLACVVLAVSAVAADDLSRYREFEIGSSLAAVTAITQTVERDVKTIHSRPALIQQVEWRPRYMTGAPVAGRESINEVVFSFVDDRLFKMNVVYDRTRTIGLTNADMIAAISDVYGAPATAVLPRANIDVLDAAVVIAEWRQEDAHIALRRSGYNDSFSLVLTSLSLDMLARRAQATSSAIDAREAPQREADLVKKRADDARKAEEEARTTNKKVFRP